MTDETTSLLEGNGPDHHAHFCLLIGMSPSNKSDKNSLQCLYTRALRKRRAQNINYSITAALSNTLLLSQIVLGATLTALGASSSSHVLITIFGVANTIIAGLVAYLKSRGQPMRARMFLDDLEHVVDEIENSRVMWLGIKHGVHGYDEVDVNDKCSVRSEVARLTRLYESAVKKYVQNNPELYSAGAGALDPITGLKARSGAAPVAGHSPNPGPVGNHGDEESPATSKKRRDEKKNAAVSISNCPATAKGDDQGRSAGEGASSDAKEVEDSSGTKM
ncbi:MAG: hypothetical protein Q9218_004516 [Villophora microphyllina]